MHRRHRDGAALVGGGVLPRRLRACAVHRLHGRCDAVRYRGDATLIVHSQAFSSMRASRSPHHGCAMGVPRNPAVDAPVTHGHPAPPSIEGGSVPRHQSTSGGSSLTNASCQHPLSGQLALLDIAVIAGRPSDDGPRCNVTTAALTHSGHCAAFRTPRIHRYSVPRGTLAIRASGAVWCLSACCTKT
jgi:hypothetical protein